VDESGEKEPGCFADETGRDWVALEGEGAIVAVNKRRWESS
jgi:hypothetical protein